MGRRDAEGEGRFVHRFVAPFAVGAVVAAGGGLAAHAADPQVVLAAHATDIRWQTDLLVAHRKAVSERKPLLIVFSAEWCGYCRKLERTTLADRSVSALVRERFVPVHLDMDQHPRVAEVLEVRALPATVLLSPDADLLARKIGFVEAEPFRRLLDDGLKKLRDAEADAQD